MKSIVQEASSIEKAIQRAWIEAGSPAEFSVRILEHPVRNFFGFLKRSAKVALVFPSQEKTVQKPGSRDQQTKKAFDQRHGQQKTKSPHPSSEQVAQKPQHQQKPSQEKRPVEPSASSLTQALTPKLRPIEPKNTIKHAPTERKESHIVPIKSDILTKQTTTLVSEKAEGPTREQASWGTELTAAVEKQLRTILQTIKSAECPYTVNIQGRELLITFTQPILESKEQDRRLFAGISPLLMTIIKREFKKALRGYRIVLGHAE